MQIPWSEKVSVGALTEADLDSVQDIEQEEASPWNREAVRSELVHESAFQLVARLDNKIVGWGCCRYLGTEAELLKIAVSLEYRRAGIATLLLDRLVGLLAGRNVKRIFLEVRSKNHPATAFYHDYGFSEIGRRAGYYKQPQDDALILRRILFSER